MKPLHVLSLCAAYILFNLSLSAQCNQNILLNPSFEAPVVGLIGNNITSSYTFNGWTMTGNVFNVIRTNGSAYPSGPDNAQDGIQYVDITSAGGTIYQNFTISGSPLPVIFGGYFSSREASSYSNWTASIQIYSLPSNTLVSTSGTKSFTAVDGGIPQQETWHYLYGLVTLDPGDYKYLVNMGDYGNFDAAFVSADCILPVRLNFFDGEYLNNTVKLTWKAEEQLNLTYFEVEKSTDARKFTVIKKILSSNRLLYTCTDPDSPAGTMYYRLKMLDKDGKISYSNIIRIHTKGSYQLQVGPNPLSDHLSISGLGKHGSVRLIDLSGRTLLKKEIRSQAISIDVSFLQKGIYLLEYFNGIQKQTRKVIKK